MDDITNEKCAAQLVVRRGQEFKVKLRLDEPYGANDLVKVISRIGMLYWGGY